MPTMENPPPNAPFMKQIRNTPAKATRIVAAVSSMRPPPWSRRAGVYERAGRWLRRAQVTKPSSHPRPVRSGHGTVDRRFDLAPYEADVPQCAVVELAKA